MNYNDIKIISEEEFLKKVDECERWSYKRLSKRKKENMRFKYSLDPNLDENEKFWLKMDFLHRRDEDALEAMDSSRPDFKERRIAFYESLLDAIQTDEESWSHKSLDVLNALHSNNAEQLLVALCGWGANSLAKRAGILPDDALDFSDYTDDLKGKLIISWDNGEETVSECNVAYGLEVNEFDTEIFKTYADSAKIVSVIVEVTPYYSEECNRFNCISREERDRTNDKFSYWYRIDDEDEDEGVGPDDDNEE